MTLRILIAVTHLLGAGHLTRAAALARAFARAGHGTTLVSGGMPARLVASDGVDFVQLPPIRTVGTDFKGLLDETGAPVNAARLGARRDQLLAALESVRPDVVITELFPFGRRVLADEFLALVDKARAMQPRPLVACSIRDILVAPTKPARVEETHDRLVRLYDLVLVHGDPELAPLEASWPTDERIRPLLRYSGYVDEGVAPPPPLRNRNGILVSGGSSAASLPLYHAALDASRTMTQRPWRILVGGGVPDEGLQSLRAVAPPHVMVERARPDFRSLLCRAAVSVSQAGYNTAVDLLRTGTPAVLVPFEAGHETEQRLRAECLQARGLATVVPEAELSPARLAKAIEAALNRQAPSRPEQVARSVDLDGAERSVRLIESLNPRVGIAAPRTHWEPLTTALRRARDDGRTPVFWWRDDDAAADTPQLRRLLRLAGRHHAPVALAVVPGTIEPSLPPVLADEPNVAALVHGFAHANHAPAGEKKAEFGAHRALSEMADEADNGLTILRRRLGGCVLPVFVPPWNRIAPDLPPRLAAAGYRGVSTFGPRKLATAPEWVQVNTHIDPIDWRGTQSVLDQDRLIATAAGAVALDEPIGLLTHHRVHDDAVWRFCEAFLDQLVRNNIHISLAAELFCDKNRIVAQA
jgi:predicted glycosyltransferase